MDEGVVNKDKLKMADRCTAVNVFEYPSEICQHGVKRQKCPHEHRVVKILRIMCRNNDNEVELRLLDDVHTFHSKLFRLCGNCFGKIIRYDYFTGRRELFIRIFACRPLPLDQEWPQWAWEVQASVDARRNNCREAVMTILLFIQPGNPTRSRDVMTMIAKRIWETRFNEEWEKN